jgi:hypothetical protein
MIAEEEIRRTAAMASLLTGVLISLVRNPNAFVPGPHGSSELPQTIAELDRILRLNRRLPGKKIED